jgi:hypothetical protein
VTSTDLSRPAGSGKWAAGVIVTLEEADVPAQVRTGRRDAIRLAFRAWRLVERVEYVMDDISWGDLNPAEQRAIAVLGAGISIEICDADAVRSLRRAGLLKGFDLTPEAEQLRRAAVLRTLAPQMAMASSLA